MPLLEWQGCNTHYEVPKIVIEQGISREHGHMVTYNKQSVSLVH